jgi:HPt (histidine-containing phosphotransfer) domain-containing protein
MNLAALEQPAVFSALASDPDLRDLVELFARELPQRVEQIALAHDSGDWETLQRLAHQLKGAAGSYGFHQITPFAAGLEMAVKNGEPKQNIHRALAELIELCSRVRPGRP